MEFRHSYAVVIYIFCVYFVNNAIGMPRTVEKHDEVVPEPIQTLGVVKLEKSVPVQRVLSVQTPGRIACEFEEATEDSICVEQCRPKGYAHGLCVNYTCSCI